MKCEFCDTEFDDSMDGLATKTFHIIVKHPSEVNE